MSDMDATIPEGVAYSAALAHNPRTGKTLYTPFRSDEGHENPCAAADAFRRACGDDFDGWIWSRASNEAALEIKSQALLRSLGLD